MSIRTHTIPRKYLEYFGMIEDISLIWRYSVENYRWAPEPAPIKKVGRRVDFYTQAEEHQLNKIEDAALYPLDQLRIGQQLDDKGRLAVGIYLVAMLARVERTRNKMHDSLDKEITNVRSASKTFSTKWNVPEDFLLNYLDEKAKMLQEDPLRTRDSVLHRVLELPETLDHLMQMHWRVFDVTSSERFLTSDNPVFISELQA